MIVSCCWRSGFIADETSLSQTWGSIAPVGHHHETCKDVHESCTTEGILVDFPGEESVASADSCHLCLMHEVREASVNEADLVAAIDATQSLIGGLARSDREALSFPPYSLASPRAPPSRSI